MNQFMISRFVVFLFLCQMTLVSHTICAESTDQANDKGPKVISRSVVPLPPYMYQTGQSKVLEEEKVEKKADEKLNCTTFDDSICTKKCNPPVQDVGERCSSYEERSDGVCICKECEVVECGDST